MRYVRYVWHILISLAYLAIVIGILSVATTRFEVLVLAGMIQLYAAVLYNFSLIGVVTDVNNYAGFVRFRILAAAQGITENEDGTFEQQEKAIAERLKNERTVIYIQRVANAVVSIYVLFKIVQAIFLRSQPIHGERPIRAKVNATFCRVCNHDVMHVHSP